MFLGWLKIGNFRELFLKNSWRKSRTFREGKAEKYGRVLRVISRLVAWNPHPKLTIVVDLKAENQIYQFVSGNVVYCGAKYECFGKCNKKYISPGWAYRGKKWKNMVVL